jgi:hypothetical protein
MSLISIGRENRIVVRARDNNNNNNNGRSDNNDTSLRKSILLISRELDGIQNIIEEHYDKAGGLAALKVELDCYVNQREMSEQFKQEMYFSHGYLPASNLVTQKYVIMWSQLVPFCFGFTSSVVLLA